VDPISGSDDKDISVGNKVNDGNKVIDDIGRGNSDVNSGGREMLDV